MLDPNPRTRWVEKFSGYLTVLSWPLSVLRRSGLWCSGRLALRCRSLGMQSPLGALGAAPRAPCSLHWSSSFARPAWSSSSAVLRCAVLCCRATLQELREHPWARGREARHAPAALPGRASALAGAAGGTTAGPAGAQLAEGPTAAAGAASGAPTEDLFQPRVQEEVVAVRRQQGGGPGAQRVVSTLCRASVPSCQCLVPAPVPACANCRCANCHNARSLLHGNWHSRLPFLLTAPEPGRTPAFRRIQPAPSLLLLFLSVHPPTACQTATRCPPPRRAPPRPAGASTPLSSSTPGWT